MSRITLCRITFLEVRWIRTAEVVDAWSALEIFITLRVEVEVIFHRSFDALVQRAIGRYVEVHLHDLRVGILLCQANRRASLRNFSIKRYRCVVCHTYDQLLGQGTGSIDDSAAR